MKSVFVLFTAMLFTLVSSAQCEELDAMFSRVKDFVAAKNYSKALEELQWAEKEIQKMNSAQVQTYFPDSLAGFTGGKIESSNAMGITNTERDYKKGADIVKVSLTGGSPGGGGLGGLAALGKMAAMFGGEAGMESVRIAGRTAQVQTSPGGTNDLTIFLDSGSMLKFESSKVEISTLREMAEAMQIEALDNYLRGLAK